MPSLSNKKTVIAVHSLGDAFKNALTDKSLGFLYIKAIDLKEWTENQKAFVMKKFGDRESGLILTFIYKNGDKEFEPDNLIAEIFKFKKSNLYESN
jgi:hypothetical protein